MLLLIAVKAVIGFFVVSLFESNVFLEDALEETDDFESVVVREFECECLLFELKPAEAANEIVALFVV